MRKCSKWLLVVSAALAASLCAVVAPEGARGQTRHVLRGIASWYGRAHHGRRTASGGPFNMFALTAAHRTLPFGTRIRVTHEETGESVEVVVNDRGPYLGQRVLDLSRAAAAGLGILRAGLAQVRLEILLPPPRAQGEPERPIRRDAHTLARTKLGEGAAALSSYAESALEPPVDARVLR